MTLCEMAVDGVLEQYWNNEVAIKVLSTKQFYTVYQNINSGISHKVSNILTNQDLAYGKLINQLISLAEAETGLTNIYKGSHLKTLAFMIHAIYTNLDVKDSYIRNWSYENVWSQNCKAATADFIKPKPKVSKCTINDIQELTEGLCAVFNYLSKLAKERRKYEKQLKESLSDPHSRKRALNDAYPAVLTSTTIIGYILCAATREEFKVPQDASLWYDEIFSRGTRLTKIAEGGQRGLAGKVDFSRFLDKAIFGNNKVKKTAIRYWPQ